MTKMIFGCGYLGLRIARRWRAAGDQVFAVTRSPRRSQELAAEGIRPIVGDLTQSVALPRLPSLHTVLFAVGFDRRSGKSIHEVYVGGLSRALEALSDLPSRLIYISSTGVYGQTDGNWVDEQSPCQPTRAGGRACLAAEQLLARHPVAVRSIVLRLAGLYGPGRIPKLAALRAGQPLAAAAQGYLNLIHVDDAVEAVLAAEQKAPLPSRYVISDGCPVRRGEFYDELARLVRVAPPRFVPPPAGSSNAERGSSDKRVRNVQMLENLLPAVAFPSYREGLAGIVGRE